MKRKAALQCMTFKHTGDGHCFPYIPSRELTYPTWGKGKSSSKLPFWGDMLVPWRVIGDKLIKPIVGVYMHISSDVFFWLVILLMVQKSSEPVEVGSLSHDLQGSMHPTWCRIASISRFQQ